MTQVIRGNRIEPEPGGNFPAPTMRNIDLQARTRQLTGNEGATNRADAPGENLVAVPNTIEHPALLSAYQLTVLALLAEGLTQMSAARRLDISGRTLRRHLRSICARLQVHEPIEAVVWAARNELL